MTAGTELSEGLQGFLQDLRILEYVARSLEDLPREPAARSPRHSRCAEHTEAASPVGRRWRQFILKRRIASGSYGTVFRAFDTRRRLDVALKLPNGHDPYRESTLQLFQEARRLRLVRHPGVVRMQGIAIDNGRAGLWMELVRGRTLDRMVRTGGPLAIREVLRIGSALAHALGAVHGAGLVHGDIKPQNVMRESGGRVVLIDFGCAQLRTRSTMALRRVTGTPLYLAPEVMTGSPVSTASDIYSLGVLLFHLASGDYPVRAETLDELLDAHAHGEVRRLHVLRPDLPPAFCRIVEKAIDIDPRARYASARAFQRALARVGA